MTPTSSQNQGLLSRSRCSASTATKMAVATVKHTAETAVDSIMAVCLRCRSANVP